MTKSTNFPSSPRPQAKPWLLMGWALAVCGFLYLPIVVSVVISFNDSPILSLPFKGITFD